MLAATVLLSGLAAHAGGPRLVAGTAYFDPAAKGQPLHWSNGALAYYTDQGQLGSMDNATANAMVASAAGIWNGVQTAAVTLSAGGTLDEDVNGNNVTPLVLGTTATTTASATSAAPAVMPRDVQSTATRKQLAIIYDSDGSVLDALLGEGASDPGACNDNGAIAIVDNMSVDGTLAHALIVLNGLCTGTSTQNAILTFQLTRAMGQVLGLDWSQANQETPLPSWVDIGATEAGLALMHVSQGRSICSSNLEGFCMPDQRTLRSDDTAALSRLYPVMAANISQFPGKSLTAQNTIAIHGKISFSSGQGMQGVNVVVRPLIPGTNNADWNYTVSAVSGTLFHGQNVNPVNGTTNYAGDALDKFGSDDSTLEGAFDLSAIPLPSGQQQADYQLTFEPIDRLDSQAESVGAYVTGNPTPSGTMPTIILRGLSAGSSVNQDVTVQDSATSPAMSASGKVTAPVVLPQTGEWIGRLGNYGHSDWFSWPVAGNRVFTVEAVALDETGSPTTDKARVVLGIWDTANVVDSLPVVGTPQAFNAQMTGGTSLRVVTQSVGKLRLGLADQRGDGRPDYVYKGRLLYAATVSPARLKSSGGTITISGTGFRTGNTVSVNGVAARVTSIEPTEIVAIAPAAAGATGTVVVKVNDPATLGLASISDGLSYDAATGDILNLISGPQGTVAMDVPLNFKVQAMGADGLGAGGVTVTYSITAGNATLGCRPTCRVTAAGDGSATITVTAISTGSATVTASLADGASVQTTFTGGVAPSIAAISDSLYLAQGSTYAWTPQVIVLQAGVPMAARVVRWTSSAVVATATSSTNAQGIAQASVTAGPLAASATVAVNACISSTVLCTQLAIVSVDPGQAALDPISGAGQTLQVSDTPAAVVVRVVDNLGHPMAAGKVMFYESLDAWTPDCPVHGRCTTAEVLTKQTVTAISGADGLVTLTPLTHSGVPTRLWVTAVTGNTAALDFEIERHP